MKYYKALYDKRCFSGKSRSIISPAFVKNELYTEKELWDYCKRNNWDFDRTVEWNFRIAEISKRKIYWFFGCRFAYGDEAA